MAIILISGGFDPLHEGHVSMVKACAELGDVVVALNSDDWLLRKKGYVFMEWDRRREIMMSLKGVTRVINAGYTDDTCLDALKMIGPDVFANGGDRLAANTPEVEYCLNNGIALLFNAGGGKINSSSELVDKARQNRIIM